MDPLVPTGADARQEAEVVKLIGRAKLAGMIPAPPTCQPPDKVISSILQELVNPEIENKAGNNEGQEEVQGEADQPETGGSE